MCESKSKLLYEISQLLDIEVNTLSYVLRQELKEIRDAILKVKELEK